MHLSVLVSRRGSRISRFCMVLMFHQQAQAPMHSNMAVATYPLCPRSREFMSVVEIHVSKPLDASDLVEPHEDEVGGPVRPACSHRAHGRRPCSSRRRPLLHLAHAHALRPPLTSPYPLHNAPPRRRRRAHHLRAPDFRDAIYAGDVPPEHIHFPQGCACSTFLSAIFMLTFVAVFLYQVV
ncbi:hypothetical protein C2E23DRAFT_401796 [Lenzites betulinus]|nr:hypothetical protein C2E23DRAFT_401796 [Lenzites betulinus]